MINLATKLQPIAKPIRANLEKHTSNLKPLAAVPYPEYMPIDTVDMIIPGGLDRKEKAYYLLTGKMPKSVQERWVEAKEDVAVSDKDQVVTVDKWIDGQLGIHGKNLHDADPELFNSNVTDIVDTHTSGNIFDDFI